jgi:hypothetical protein
LPPAWALTLVQLVSVVEPVISTADQKTGLSSDDVLRELTPGLQSAGYQVETGKTRASKIRRPVLFGDQGEPSVAYEIDAWHPDEGIVLEVEAGRGAAGNADYRDIIRMSLILDAENMALLLPIKYRTTAGERAVSISAYERTRNQLDAIYASSRLRLPFGGAVLIGY